jgi:hypothetical protein
MSVEKVSLSVPASDLAWARKQAKARKQSLSAVFSHALHLARQLDARRRVLAELPESSEDGLLAVDRQWRDVSG